MQPRQFCAIQRGSPSSRSRNFTWRAAAATDDGQEQQANSNGRAGPDREPSCCPQTTADRGGVAAVADQDADDPGHVANHLGHSLHHLKE